MRSQSIINLDPIDRKKRKGFFGRLLVTRYGGGESVTKTVPFGHYMFCGRQRQGKTASVIWYMENRVKWHKKRRLSYQLHDDCDDTHLNETGKRKTCKNMRFDTPPKIKVWSNFGIGKSFKKNELFKLIDELDPHANEVRFFLVDEIHGYFPRGGADKETQKITNDLLIVFSQLAKRNAYIFSTAQVYGRLDKALREQCLYMVNCTVSATGRLVNDFIEGDEIICDELGRWAGDPKFIYKHGLSRYQYDTKRLIRE